MNYLNTRDSFDTFMQAVASNIYVDKSMMIEEIMKRTGSYDKYICITRPRRFGKSTNAGMLAAYFTKGYDSGPVFENLSIHDSSVYGKKQNQCNVIHIDFSRRPDLCRNYEDYIMSIIRALKEDLLEAYPFLSGKYFFHGLIPLLAGLYYILLVCIRIRILPFSYTRQPRVLSTLPLLV